MHFISHGQENCSVITIIVADCNKKVTEHISLLLFRIKYISGEMKGQMSINMIPSYVL